MTQFFGATPPPYLTVRSASLVLDGISERIIREAIAMGELKCSRFSDPSKKTQRQIDGKKSGAIRIPYDALMEWAESKSS